MTRCFDACDEMGICVWLDFKFACSAYPAFDEQFMENVRQEARDNLRRLRHHPCIAVWCGNNEISLMTEGRLVGQQRWARADYDKLFKDLLAQQVRELAPQANYVSGSPDCGDTHYWEVWHGNKPFDAYRTSDRLHERIRFSIFSRTENRPRLHERSRSRFGAHANDEMAPAQRRWQWAQQNLRHDDRLFPAAEKFRGGVVVEPDFAGLGIKTGAEYWRQTMPKSMGCVFWQFNDCWPVASWSSVDYFGRWKALHYLARHFYSPMLVSGLENPAAGTIDIFVTSDRLENARGKLSWTATDANGKTLVAGSLALEIPACQSLKVRTLDLAEQCRQQGAKNVLTWLKLEVDGKTASENLVLFALPKEIKLADPQIKATVEKARAGFLVTLAAEKPALWSWLNLDEADAKYSDNFVHLAAGSPRQILVQPNQPMSEADFEQNLRVRSLFDTYS